MKKLYIAPTLSVEQPQVKATILAGSNPNVTINTEGSVDAADIDVKEQSSWDIWED